MLAGKRGKNKEKDPQEQDDAQRIYCCVFSGILLKQHVFDSAEIFAVGIADGYDEALYMVEAIAGKVYEETGETDIRRYILARQKEFEETGR